MGGVVIDHIYYAFHSQGMDGIDQVPEVVKASVCRVHGPVVGDGVGAAQASFLAFDSYRMDGHEPDHVGPQGLDPGKIRLKGAERAFGCMVSDIHAVDDEVSQ